MLGVLDGLWRATGGALEVTFVTALPEALLRARWGRPCAVVAHQGRADFGMVMTSSTGIDVAASLSAHRAALAAREADITAEAAILSRLRPHGVLSCISPRSLDAAARLGLPAVGLGPFTWAEVVAAYADGSAEVAAVIASLRASYANAAAVVATTPFVPMDLPNLRPVGPVGLLGQRRPETLPRAPGEHLALVALGGIPEAVPVADWPAVPGWRLLTPEDLGALSVSDAIASVDAVITKPGYGTFVEAACAGTPVIWRERPDWPEMPGLGQWLARHVPAFEIDSETFSRGAVADHLHTLVTMPRDAVPVTTSGNAEAAAIILDLFLS